LKKGMPNSEIDALKDFLKNVVSMELRVENSEVQNTIKMMDSYGLIYKNSWASMELTDHTVIDFWKKELIKSSTPKN
jgi:Mn-dependent DtxR family transcriptional regulator